MVLTHAVDISVAHAVAQGADENMAPPKDMVLTVPMYATQMERLALLDAAELVDLNILQLLDETTAAAVHYAMDKSFPDEQLFLFYNMGATATQVALVRFYSYDQPQKFGKPKTVPAIEVLGKAWDETLGGEAFDHLVVEYLADQFNLAWSKTGRGEGKDVRAFPRAMTKLRLQANKVKHVLSANTEIPVYMESVHDDVSLNTHVTRLQLEEMAAPLLERAVRPIHRVLAQANKTLDDLTEIELIGGGMRIPRIQAEISKATAGRTLGLHINADESMALGAAFCGANISTAFRVRHVGLTDINPFTMSVTLQDLPTAEKKKAKDDEVWTKQATIFKAFGKMSVKKTIAFTHDRDVHCDLDYVKDENLPEGTELPIARYNITGIAEFAGEMAKKELGRPKVSLQFELSASGITALVRAEASVEETYMAEEEIEVDDDEADANATANTTEGNATIATDSNVTAEERKLEFKQGDNTSATENATSSNATNATDKGAGAKKAAKKPKKKIKVEKVSDDCDYNYLVKFISASHLLTLKTFGVRSVGPAFVLKEKKRTHRKVLKVDTYHVGRVKPHSPELMEASRDKLLAMAKRDKERMMLEEARNNVESYIYKIKNRLEDDGETLAKVSTEEQREQARQLAMDAEEWLDGDGYGADLTTMKAKFAEISEPFEKILLRVSEMKDRPAAIEALQKKLTDVEQLMVKWETSMPQITEEERSNVLEKVEDIRKWISENEEAQAAKKPHEEPAFLSKDVPQQSLPLETLVLRLSRKPKPKPAKNATKTADATKSDGSNETATNTTTATNKTASESKSSAAGNESASEGEGAETEDEL